MMVDNVNFIVGIIIGVVVGCVIIGIMYATVHTPDPCAARITERRAVLIDSHERCMTETNCIYEDWDIRRYDKHLEAQAKCEANRNED